MELRTFRDVNAVVETDYTFYNRNGDILEWFTLNYIDTSDDEFRKNLKKILDYEERNAKVKVINCLNDVLRVTVVVD